MLTLYIYFSRRHIFLLDNILEGNILAEKNSSSKLMYDCRVACLKTMYSTMCYNTACSYKVGRGSLKRCIWFFKCYMRKGTLLVTHTIMPVVQCQRNLITAYIIVEWNKKKSLFHVRMTMAYYQINNIQVIFNPIPRHVHRLYGRISIIDRLRAAA